MKIELSLTPPPADIEPGKFRFFIKMNYAMFPEMKEQEFKDEEEKYMFNEYIELEPERDENGQIVVDSIGVAEYRFEMDLPYGSYQPQVYVPVVRNSESNDGSGEYQELPQQYLVYFRDYCTPKPISRE